MYGRRHTMPITTRRIQRAVATVAWHTLVVNRALPATQYTQSLPYAPSLPSPLPQPPGNRPLTFMMSEALMWNFLELFSARPTNGRFCAGQQRRNRKLSQSVGQRLHVAGVTSNTSCLGPEDFHTGRRTRNTARHSPWSSYLVASRTGAPGRSCSPVPPPALLIPANSTTPPALQPLVPRPHLAQHMALKPMPPPYCYTVQHPAITYLVDLQMPYPSPMASCHPTTPP